MTVATNGFEQRWDGLNSALVQIYILGHSAGLSLETAVTDMVGNVIPSVPWVSAGTTTGGTQVVARWVPTGGPYVAAAKINGVAYNSTAVNARGFCVGDSTLFALGQSNAHGLWTSGSVPSNPRTAMFRNSDWSAPQGAGLGTYVDHLETLTGVPQCGICYAVGATAITRVGFQSHSWLIGAQNGCWNDFDSGLVTDTEHALSSNNNRIARVVSVAGESDTIGVPESVYASEFLRAWGYLEDLIIDRSPLVYTTLVRSDYGTYVSGADPTPIRAAQSSVGTVVADLDDYQTDSTNIHLTASGYASLGLDMAAAIHASEL